MSRLRWRKILIDLRQNSLRSVLAIFAMVIGIFAVGSILTAYAILTREINVNFLRTNPASAILYVDNADRDVADAVAHLLVGCHRLFVVADSPVELALP